MAIISSSVCLVAGFWLGTMMEKEVQLEPKYSNSSRKIRVSRNVGQAVRDGGAGVSELWSKKDRFADDEISRAKWRAGLLQLDLIGVLEARDALMEIEKTKADREPLHEVSGDLLLLLSRWYELEGEEVLAWIRAQDVWSADGAFKAATVTVLDGFHRDPDRGFELVLELQKEEKRVADDPFLGDQVRFGDLKKRILYQIGRWGNEPAEMFEQFDSDGELRKAFSRGSDPFSEGGKRSQYSAGFGFPETPGGISEYSHNPKMKAFAQGLLDAGKVDLIRELMGGLEGGARDAFDGVLGERAADLGWQEVKRQIDVGNLNATWERSIEVLNGLSKSDRKSALDWFVSLDQGESVSRDERIRWAALPGGAFEEPLPPGDDPFGRESKYDFVAARDWLDEMAAKGEPVREARLAQHRHAVRRGDWEWVKKDREFLTAAEWEGFRQHIIQSALRSVEKTNDEVRWALTKVQNEGWSANALSEFGWQEEAQAQADELNRNQLERLRNATEEAEVGIEREEARD